MMKFAYCSSMFRLRSLQDAIKCIHKAGFCAIELMADRPHAYPEDLKASDITVLNAYLNDRKMKVSNLNCTVSTVLGDAQHPSWIEEDWQEREKRIRYTLDCMRLAAAIGVPHIITGSGGPIPVTMNQWDAWRLYVANMHRVLPLAQKLGIKILLQAEPGWLIENSDQMLALLKDLDFHPYLGVNFDAGHYFCMEGDLCRTWEKLGSHAAHVHLEDISGDRSQKHVQLGEGAIDIPGFLKCLKQSNYEGFVTIRLEVQEQRAEEIMVSASEYLKEIGFIGGKECEIPANE